jgi:3-phenylpropionate/trans-cinnamate dioxygenase ferredoxin subunit
MKGVFFIPLVSKLVQQISNYIYRVKDLDLSKYLWQVIYNEEERATIDNLPEGKIVRCFVDDNWLCITKFENEVIAFIDKCPHAGASLFRAECKEGKVVCPIHRFGFDLKTGQGHGLYLENYPVILHEGKYVIGFKKNFLGF